MYIWQLFSLQQIRNDIVPIAGTDHRGVVTCLNGSNWGPSYWKFNQYLLHDPVYVEKHERFSDVFLNAYEGFHKDDKRASFPFQEFKKLGKDLWVFLGNIKIKEIQGLKVINSNFWKAMLKNFIEFNVIDNIEGMLPECEWEEQPLWNNHNVR